MTSKSNDKDSLVTDLLTQDDKMGKIVDEVDRFFRSVHAEVEDWKFAMEDDGDGTRIFVRFQIHIGSTQSASATRHSRIAAKDAGGARSREEDPAAREGSLRATERSDIPPRAASPKVDVDVAVASDPDLAFFIEEWKHRRESRPHGEFHKAGAPMVEPTPRTPVHPRHRGAAERT
jgi:hypothetical protein